MDQEAGILLLSLETLWALSSRQIGQQSGGDVNVKDHLEGRSWWLGVVLFGCDH